MLADREWDVPGIAASGLPTCQCILPACNRGELHNTVTFATQSKHWASKQSRVGNVSSAPTNPGAPTTTA
jgi:hypothetical protein